MVVSIGGLGAEGDRKVILRVLTATACLLVTFATGVRADDRPNILVVITDDLGWTDIGAFWG